MSRGPIDLPGVDVDLVEARDWVGYQFAPGSRPRPRLPSVLLMEQLSRFDVARVLGASLQPDQRLNSHSHGSTTSRADARSALQWAHARGASILEVEDEGAVRGGPHLRPSAELADVAFVGDLVLRWCRLTTTGDGALTLLEDGSFGYPRNAYICRTAAAELGLVDDHSLSASEVDGIAAAACGLITSVWDDESYVTLWSLDSMTE